MAHDVVDVGPGGEACSASATAAVSETTTRTGLSSRSLHLSDASSTWTAAGPRRSKKKANKVRVRSLSCTRGTFTLVIEVQKESRGFPCISKVSFYIS